MYLKGVNYNVKENVKKGKTLRLRYRLVVHDGPLLFMTAQHQRLCSTNSQAVGNLINLSHTKNIILE
jgi:hypothetical protein